MKEIEWFFNQPPSPHMGGYWERLISSVKEIFKEVLQFRYPQEDTRIFLIECECILDSRPVTYVSLDSHDTEALTPNHFLIGSPHSAFPYTKTSDRNLNLLSNFRASQRMANYQNSRCSFDSRCQRHKEFLAEYYKYCLSCQRRKNQNSRRKN